MPGFGPKIAFPALLRNRLEHIEFDTLPALKRDENANRHFLPGKDKSAYAA